MTSYEIGKAVSLDLMIERPRFGAAAWPETWKLAVNTDGDVFGLVYPEEKFRISHMSYGIQRGDDYGPDPLGWLAENGPEGQWYFDAGQTRPAVRASGADLLTAWIELGILKPPFTVTWEDGQCEDDFLFPLLDRVNGDTAIVSGTVVTFTDATGWAASGRMD